ncbi:MAG TPA: hypothetical protein VK530_04965 [Candidatus Acidoferrum sp.]|nr:hypothetical protein [Candidatus Acidoferrum sp.]
MPYRLVVATKNSSLRVADPHSEAAKFMGGSQISQIWIFEISGGIIPDVHVKVISTLFATDAYVPRRMFKWSLVLLFVIAALLGCRERRAVAPGTGTYGPPGAQPTTMIRRLSPDHSGDVPFTNDALSVIQTELSPATLWHSTSRTMSFFANMPQTGIGGPSYVCISTEQGPKIFLPGGIIDPARMRESWFVVWWAGASGWTNWDAPWFLTLQHRPKKIVFDTNGLHFTFTNQTGYAATMPMYGYYKPLPARQESSPFFRLKEKKKRILTWEWSKALPADPLARARYWASALREFPVYCEDSFSVDRAHDSVVLRQKFRFISWNDDWKTKHLKLAPVSPVLAHAFREGFSAEFSKEPFDMEIFTPHGPLYGIEGADSYDVTLPVLRYVNETEQTGAMITNTSAVVQSALSKLREIIRTNVQFSSAHFPDEWDIKALTYLDAPTRTNAIKNLKRFFRDDLLATNRVENVAGERRRLSANMLPTIWAYAHFIGDWELIRERWPAIKALFITPAETRWAGFGRDEIPALGDQAAPCLAFARLAYKVGDIDSYNYACQMFARELSHHWVKQRGTRYFRENQPYHSMDVMDDNVFLTSLKGAPAGWHIDGPKYPRNGAEQEFGERWMRFDNEDVARFYRNFLSVDVMRELDVLQSRGRAGQLATNNSPSLMQLRSLLLKETPRQLTSNAPPEIFSGPVSRVIADCISILRTSGPVRYERLIPGGNATPFVVGIERDVAGPNVVLAQNLTSGSNAWPRITWSEWNTPAGEPWHFGNVISSTNVPKRFESTALNWNTRLNVWRE